MSANDENSLMDLYSSLKEYVLKIDDFVEFGENHDVMIAKIMLYLNIDSKKIKEVIKEKSTIAPSRSDKARAYVKIILERAEAKLPSSKDDGGKGRYLVPWEPVEPDTREKIALLLYKQFAFNKKKEEMEELIIQTAVNEAQCLEIQRWIFYVMEREDKYEVEQTKKLNRGITR